MRQLVAISSREAGSFFRSAMAPVVLTGFLMMVGLFFFLALSHYSDLSETAVKEPGSVAHLNLAEGVFQPLVKGIFFFFLLLLPAVAMRLFADEYRSGRYDLVISYPVSDHVWVLGKFLSVLLVTAVLIAASCAYYAVALWLGDPEPGPVLAAAVGLFLVAATIAAWGLFFSSLVQHQLVCYFLSFAFLILLYAVGELEPLLPDPLGQLATDLSLRGHFFRFSRGVIDSRDLLYYLGLTCLGLAGATAALAGRRLTPGRRWLRWLPAVVATVLFVLVYLIALRHPFSQDWTRNKRYSLAPQTEQVLRALERGVTVHAFFQRLDPYRQSVAVLLGACRDRTSRLQYHLHDLDRDLELVKEYGVTVAGTVVVEMGRNRRELVLPDESALINAVFRLATGSRPVVYHLLGHGEHRLDSDERGGYSGYAALLQAQGYELRPLVLAEAAAVPADADIVVIAAPKLPFAAAEVETLSAFLARGGGVLALLDPGTGPVLGDWAAGFNVGLKNDVIITATDRRQYGVGPRVVVVRETYGEHATVKSLMGLPTFFPYTQSLYPLRNSQPGVTGEAILFSSPFTWAERDSLTQVSGRARFDEGSDRAGPVPFGVALEVDRRRATAAERVSQGPRATDPTLPEGPLWNAVHPEPGRGLRPLPGSIFTEAESARLVFLGDSDFAVNENLNLYANRDLLLNLLGWLAREKVLIGVRALPSVGEPVILDEARQETLGWICILGWPLAVGLTSLVTVLRRRLRRPGPS